MRFVLGYAYPSNSNEHFQFFLYCSRSKTFKSTQYNISPIGRSQAKTLLSELHRPAHDLYKPFRFSGEVMKGISYFVFGLSIFNSFICDLS